MCSPKNAFVALMIWMLPLQTDPERCMCIRAFTLEPDDATSAVSFRDDGEVSCKLFDFGVKSLTNPSAAHMKVLIDSTDKNGKQGHLWRLGRLSILNTVPPCTNFFYRKSCTTNRLISDTTINPYCLLQGRSGMPEVTFDLVTYYRIIYTLEINIQS